MNAYLHFTIKNDTSAGDPCLRNNIMIHEKNLLKIIEKQLTLSSRFRSIERMRSSSRRETALELALKVGG